MKEENKEFDEMMDMVKHRTKSLQRALEPILQQLILVDIRRQNMPYGLPDHMVRIEEMNKLEDMLKNLIDQVLGFTNRPLKS